MKVPQNVSQLLSILPKEPIAAPPPAITRNAKCLESQQYAPFEKVVVYGTAYLHVRTNKLRS